MSDTMEFKLAYDTYLQLLHTINEKESVQREFDRFSRIILPSEESTAIIYAYVDINTDNIGLDKRTHGFECIVQNLTEFKNKNNFKIACNIYFSKITSKAHDDKDKEDMKCKMLIAGMAIAETDRRIIILDQIKLFFSELSSLEASEFMEIVINAFHMYEYSTYLANIIDCLWRVHKPDTVNTKINPEDIKHFIVLGTKLINLDRELLLHKEMQKLIAISVYENNTKKQIKDTILDYFVGIL